MNFIPLFYQELSLQEESKPKDSHTTGSNFDNIILFRIDKEIMRFLLCQRTRNSSFQSDRIDHDPEEAVNTDIHIYIYTYIHRHV